MNSGECDDASVTTSQNDEKSWIEEKQMFINKIVSLKTEIQSNALKMKSAEDHLEKLNQDLKAKDEIHLNEVGCQSITPHKKKLNRKMTNVSLN